MELHLQKGSERREVQAVQRGDTLELSGDGLDVTQARVLARDRSTLLLEIDGRLEENNEPGFRTDRGRPVVIKEPEPANLEQRSYIRRYIQDFEDPTFLTRLDERWDGYKQEIDQVPQQLLGLGADLEEAIANDGSRWNFVVEPNDTPQYLADWLTTRTAWMDAQIGALASP